MTGGGECAVRWGVIGCGAVCERKSVPALTWARHSAVVRVMGRRADRAADFARRHGIPRWGSDLAELLADPAVDAVYIATPPGAHAHLAQAALAAGKPVYVEKPLTRNLEEGAALVAAFQAARQPLFVAYYRRALPRFLRLRRLLNEGWLGEPRHVRYAYEGACPPGGPAAIGWRVDPAQSGGGLLLDLGSHLLDLLDFLLGPLECLTATAWNRAGQYDVEDEVALTFRAGSWSGAAQWQFAGRQRRDELRFTGARGTLSCSLFGSEPLVYHGPRGAQTWPDPFPRHIQQPLVQTIINALQGRGACPSTGATALRTQAIMDQALSAYYGGRDDAFWERPATWPGRRPAQTRATPS